MPAQGSPAARGRRPRTTASRRNRKRISCMPEGSHFPRPLPGAAPLVAALRAALAAPAGRVALRLSLPAPERLRIARGLMEEVAQAGGGRVLEAPDGELLLLGAEPGRTLRLGALLERLFGPAANTTLFALERDGPALMAWAARGEGRPAPPPLPAQEAAPADLGRLDAFLEALPLSRVLRRRAGLVLAGPDGRAGPGFLRLELPGEQVRQVLGPHGADGDVVSHAVRILARRVLRFLAGPGGRERLVGPRLRAVVHLPMPESPALPPEGDAGIRSGLVVTVGIEEAASPAALALRRSALAHMGVGLELDGLSASLLPLLSPEALPCDLLRLHWSPALLRPEAGLALLRFDPERLVLAGAHGAEALDWARQTGIGRIEGVAEACLT